MSIGKAFNTTIEYYDEWMKNALPNYVDIFQTAQDLLNFETRSPIDVLDLGAGTGLFSQHILDKYPSANFVLYDVAEQMLNVAKDRFKHREHQFDYIIGDYREILGNKKYDLVISSLSIHHLTNADKRNLFRSIFHLLRKDGLFINIDQVRGGTDYLEKLYWDHWIEQVNKTDQPVERIRESMDRRKKYDINATLLDQLQWLKQAGFSNVDCVYKNFFVGVFMAMKI